jgi:TolA-binding protein
MKFFGRKKKEDADSDKGSGKTDPSAAKDSATGGEDSNGDTAPVFGAKEMANARKWFSKGKTCYDDRNYDFAIESYLTGLRLWPEAVEEGHQMLRVAAHARMERGGKKAGTFEVMKHSMSAKDPLDGLCNAEWLWARDPNNPSYMEGMVKNAAKGRYEDTLLYIGPIFFETLKTAKKVSKDRLLTLLKAYEENAERCERRGDLPKSLTFHTGAMTVLQVLNSLSGENQTYARQLQNTATKVTIIKGKYDSGDDFRGSMKDSEAQKEIHDRDRLVVGTDRLAELITEAKTVWADNPGVSAKLMNLIDLLCRNDDAAQETEAIELLEAEFSSSDNYRYKIRADDIRIKQLRRKVQAATKAGDADAKRQASVDQLRFELKSIKGRVAAYPTDNRLKFQYGKLLVMARRYDDAIPVLQEARNDPKSKVRCTSLIGRCFYEKGFYSQAISTYNQGITEYDLEGDDVSKELQYWLGRSCEAAKQEADAKTAFGQVIQWDYNYKDARQRLADLEG